MQQDVSGFLSIKKTQFISMWAFFRHIILTLPLLALPWTALNPKMRWVIFTITIQAAASSMVTWLLPHYWAPIFPLIFLWTMQGFRHWKIVARHERGREQGMFLLGNILAYSLVAAMSITLYTARLAAQPTGWMWQQANIQRILEGTPELRLVVVRFGPNHSYHNEWVQNHANIDTAKVFWASDMGTEKNRQLL